MKSHNFPIDYFGVIADSQVQRLLDQSTDKRKRRTAKNALAQMAKLAGALPKGVQIEAVGVLVDAGGSIYLSFLEKEPEPSVPYLPIRLVCPHCKREDLDNRLVHCPACGGRLT